MCVFFAKEKNMSFLYKAHGALELQTLKHRFSGRKINDRNFIASTCLFNMQSVILMTCYDLDVTRVKVKT